MECGSAAPQASTLPLELLLLMLWKTYTLQQYKVTVKKSGKQ
jgi:hypothetical protein